MKSIFFLIITITVFPQSVLFSQWQQTNGPTGGIVNAITVIGTTLFAGTNSGIYRSTDNGSSWTNVALTNGSVNAFCMNGSTVFAATSAGMYRTSDNGSTWNKVNTGVTSVQVNACASGNGALFIGTDGGVFRSSDNGGTWVASGSFSIPVVSVVAASAGSGRTSIYAGCHGKGADGTSGVFLSTDNGSTWSKTEALNARYNDDTPYGSLDGTLAVAGSTVFAGGTRASNWMLSDSLPNIYFSDLSSAEDLANPLSWNSTHQRRRLIAYGGPNQSDLYSYVSDPYNSPWLKVDVNAINTSSIAPTQRPLASKSFHCVVRSGALTFIAADDLGILKSDDDGNTWTVINNGIINSTIVGLALVPGTTSSPSLLARTAIRPPAEGSSMIFRSTDKGTSWTSARNGLSDDLSDVVSITNNSGATVAIASTVQPSLFSSPGGVYRSTDNGLTWLQSDGGMESDTKTYPTYGRSVAGLAVVGSNVFAVVQYPSLYNDNGLTDYTSLYRSTDYGASWQTVTSPLGLPTWIGAPSTGAALFISDGINVSISTDAGASWVRLDQFKGNQITAVGANGTTLFVSTRSNGVFRSFDRGGTWTAVNSGLSTLSVNDLAVVRSRLFIATDGAGVFMSLDNGDSWTSVVAGLGSRTVSTIASDSSNVFVGTTDRGVFRYTGSIDPVASLAPSTSAQVSAGTPFWVEVKVGDPNPVTDLETISFYLSSNQSQCTYVDSTATYGPFLTQPRPPIGTIVPLSLYWKPGPQTVSISLTWQLKPGMSGQGVVARAQFTTPTAFTSARDITFSIKNVRATNSSGNPIDLTPTASIIHIVVGGGEIWPGDCNNDGVVNAADILPIGVYYGQALGTQNTPGMVWQGYLREGWSSDVGKKKLLADANGDGNVNSVDVLAIGLNYGKTHQPVILGKTSSPQMADGILQVGSPENKPTLGGSLKIPITLKSSKPVYGVAFNLKYGTNTPSSAGGPKLLRVDTTNSMFGGGLLVSHSSDEDGSAEIGLTKTQGTGVAQGVVLNLVFDAPPNARLWAEVSNVIGNDELGNSVNLAGSVFRPESDVENGSAGIPTENAMMQNYPNPFNPATTIRFQLAEPGSVSMKVFDVLGREVVTLVNGRQAAGRFSVTWDASKMSSGIYYCRMAVQNEAGRVFTQTQRMLLVK